MVVPCAVLPTDCSGWPASCFNGECYSTPTMVRQQRRRSQRSLSSTGTDIPSSRPTFGRAPRASAVREAAQRHWRQPARNVLDSGSTVLRSTGREGTPHASKRRCFAKHSNLITGRKSHHSYVCRTRLVGAKMRRQLTAMPVQFSPSRVESAIAERSPDKQDRAEEKQVIEQVSTTGALPRKVGP